MAKTQAHDTDIDFFLQLESQVWDALLTGDSDADERLLADDFLGVYGTGFAEKGEHVGQLTAGPVAQSYSLSDARLRVLGTGVVLLSYKAQWVRIRPKSSIPHETMYISSIWTQNEGVWRNIFSQDTNAES